MRPLINWAPDPLTSASTRRARDPVWLLHDPPSEVLRAGFLVVFPDSGSCGGRAITTRPRDAGGRAAGRGRAPGCPREFVGEIFIGGSNKATVLRAVTEDYLRRSGLDIKLDHGVDNMAMAMSLVASTRGLALMPAYAKNLLPWSVVSRPLEGEAPTIDLAVGYSKANTSPILGLFLSRVDQLKKERAPQTH